jgi:hypothetical protein
MLFLYIHIVFFFFIESISYVCMPNITKLTTNRVFFGGVEKEMLFLLLLLLCFQVVFVVFFFSEVN